MRGAIWTATYGGLAAKKNFAVIGLGYRPLLRTALRETTSPTAELGLLDEGVSNEVILDAMIKHFILVSRPIVCTPKGVRLCRPSEAVLDLLDPFPPGRSIKKMENCSSIMMGAALADSVDLEVN